MPPRRFRNTVTSTDQFMSGPLYYEVTQECVRQMQRKEAILSMLRPYVKRGKQAILASGVTLDDVDELLEGRCRPVWPSGHKYHRLVSLSNKATGVALA